MAFNYISKRASWQAHSQRQASQMNNGNQCAGGGTGIGYYSRHVGASMQKIDCMKSNTTHQVKWKRIVAHCRWIRIVAQRHKVRLARIEAQRRGQIPTVTKHFFIWWTCARLGILREQP